MPDLPEEAVQAAALAIGREYESLREWDREAFARAALEAAAPALAAQAVKGLDISRGSDLVADAVDAWHDAPVNEHGVIPLDEHMAFILSAVVPTVAAQARADERRKVAEEIRALADPLRVATRAFIDRHPGLHVGASVSDVLVAVADEIEGEARDSR